MDEYERQVMEDLRRDIGRIVAEREALKAQRDALKAQVAECERVSLQRQFRVDEKVNGLTEQRDALLAALRDAAGTLDYAVAASRGTGNCGDGQYFLQHLDAARAAIAAAEKGGAK